MQKNAHIKLVLNFFFLSTHETTFTEFRFRLTKKKKSISNKLKPFSLPQFHA